MQRQAAIDALNTLRAEATHCASIKCAAIIERKVDRLRRFLRLRDGDSIPTE